MVEAAGYFSEQTAEGGGKDVGPSPTNYVICGLGACTAMTLRMYAERKGWQLGIVTVDVEFWQDDRNSRIERRVSVSARLDETQHARLADICERTPVTLLLKRGVKISTTLSHEPSQKF